MDESLVGEDKKREENVYEQCMGDFGGEQLTKQNNSTISILNKKLSESTPTELLKKNWEYSIIKQIVPMGLDPQPLSL